MIRVGIYGYGNLGRGVENAIRQNDDMELYGIFTRRAPETVKTLTNAKVYKIDDILNEAKELASNGVREIILIAQDTTRYGYDICGKEMLCVSFQAFTA